VLPLVLKKPESEIGQRIDDLCREYATLKKEFDAIEYFSTPGAKPTCEAISFAEKYEEFMQKMKDVGLEIPRLIGEDYITTKLMEYGDMLKTRFRNVIVEDIKCDDDLWWE